MKLKFFAISAALLASSFTAFSQEAFKSLGLGIEIGTTGLGVELSMPLVSDHLMIKGGFNAPTLSYIFKKDIDPAVVNDLLDKVNVELENNDVEERVTTRFSSIAVEASPMLNLSTAKLMMEYYPFKKASFHISFGAYFGSSNNFLSAQVHTNKDFWADYNALRQEVEGYNIKYADDPDYTNVYLPDPVFNIGQRSFTVIEKDEAAYVDAAIKLARVRPYLGIGFGRSVPKRQLSVQFDLGVWYHSRPKFSSSNEIPFDASVSEIGLSGEYWDYLNMAIFYPQVSLRITYKIF